MVRPLSRVLHEDGGQGRQLLANSFFARHHALMGIYWHVNFRLDQRQLAPLNPVDLKGFGAQANPQ